MPNGIVRLGDFRVGSPVNRKPNTQNDVTWTPKPSEFGNPVNEPKNFGNPVTEPKNFGNQVGGVPATPTFTPAAGTYGPSQIVVIASAGADAVYYTLDGSTPTSASRLYEGSVWIPSSQTLKAIAVVNNVASGVGSSAYVITNP